MCIKCFACIYVYASCVPSACRIHQIPSNGVTDGWGHVGAENQTHVLCKSNKCFPLSHLSCVYDLILMRKTEKYQEAHSAIPLISFQNVMVIKKQETIKKNANCEKSLKNCDYYIWYNIFDGLQE